MKSPEKWKRKAAEEVRVRQRETQHIVAEDEGRGTKPRNADGF